MQEPGRAEPHAGPGEVNGSTSERTSKARARSRSRENTPSTQSSHSLDTAPLDRAMSASSVGVSSGSSLGRSSQETTDDVDKFLRKMEMEKKMQALQQRLELASVKASNGWTDMTINEIETQRLTPKSARRQSNLKLESPTSSRIPYEPPSPSRPWQLIDVLWQPLPPPSSGRYPVTPSSPSSPRKRTRDESIFHQQQQSPRSVPAGPSGHRRSSSTAMHPASPLRHFKDGEKKRRSYSHSVQPNTRQDVDAAKALTFMLGSGSPTQHTFGPPLSAPSLAPINESKHVRAHSDASHAPRRVKSNTPPKSGAKTDDTDAADLMLFLAHSPSPVTRVKPSRVNEIRGTGAARVLFQDDGPKEPRIHSNLASAPPITNNLDEAM